MKALFLCLLVAMAVTHTTSQDPARSQGPPDLIVLKQSCDEQLVFRDRDSSRHSAAADSGMDAIPSAPDLFSHRRSAVSGFMRYVYKVRVKNTGAREIQAVSWDYVVVDTGTQKEVARHQFHSKETVRPGKEATIEGTSASPPSKVVSVAALSKDAENPFTESVMLKCISYSDGTVWKDPSFKEDCPPRKHE
jgi:hypothetical protein